MCSPTGGVDDPLLDRQRPRGFTGWSARFVGPPYRTTSLHQVAHLCNVGNDGYVKLPISTIHMCVGGPYEPRGLPCRNGRDLSARALRRVGLLAVFRLLFKGSPVGRPGLLDRLTGPFQLPSGGTPGQRGQRRLRKTTHQCNPYVRRRSP